MLVFVFDGEKEIDAPPDGVCREVVGVMGCKKLDHSERSVEIKVIDSNRPH